MLIVYNLHLELVGTSVTYGYLFFLGIYVFAYLLSYLLGYVPLVGFLVIIFTGVYILFLHLVHIISGIDIISGKSISVLSGGNDLHGLG